MAQRDDETVTTMRAGAENAPAPAATPNPGDAAAPQPAPPPVT